MIKIKKILYSIFSLFLIMVLIFQVTPEAFLIPARSEVVNINVYDYKADWQNSQLWNRYILNHNAGNFTESTIVSGSYSTVNYFNFVAPKDGEITIKLDATVIHGNGTTERFYISKATSDVATVPLTTAAAKPSPTPDFDQTSSYEGVIGVFPDSRNGLSFANAIGGTGHIVNGTDALSVNTKTTVIAGENIVFALFSNKTAYSLTINEFTITYPEEIVLEGDYNYIRDFSDTQGENNWYYQPVANNNYDAQTFIDGIWQHISSANTAKFGRNQIVSSLSNYTAKIMFKVPKNGIIRIKQQFAVSGGDSNALKYGIFVGADDINTASMKPIYPAGIKTDLSSSQKTYLDGDYDDISLVTSVTEGQYIWFYFVTAAKTNYVIDLKDFNITYVDNEYTAIETFDHYNEFSNIQGPVWHYMSAEAGVNFVKQLEAYNDVDSRWQTDENTAYITGAVGNHFMQPWSTDDAVLGFKAPYSGKIDIIAENIYLNGSSIDGIKIGIFKGTDGVISGDNPIYKMKELRVSTVINASVSNVDIKKGEWIYFRVNANGSHTGDNLMIKPIIRYNAYNEKAGEITYITDFDKPYIPEEKHTESGNNLTSSDYPYVERLTENISYTAITNDDFVKGVIDGSLTKGGYLISDDSLIFDSRFNDKTTDLSGYFVKTKGIELNSVNSARIKNLTATLTNGGTLIKTDSVRDCRIMGWQISYSGTAEAELLSTKGTATKAEKSDLVIDALRFVGSGNVKGITFTDSVRYATLINSYITGVKDYAVKDSGISADSVYTANNYIEGDIILGKDSAVVKYNTVKGDVILGGNFAMIAKSKVTGNITASDKQSVSILKNTVTGDIYLINGKACAVVENTAEKISVSGGKNCIIENNNNAGRGNEGKPVSTVTVDKNGTEHYGSNVYDQSVREDIGVNEDLLAKTDNKIFVGLERKLYVNDGGNIKAVGQFVEDNAELEDDVLLAPGAYTLNSARLYNKNGLNLYFYCSLFEATTSRCSYWNFTLNNSENCSLRGLTIGYNEAALGQGIVTEVGEDYFIVESMQGYYPDMAINEYYIQNFYTLIYREGSTTPAAKSNFTGEREYLGDGLTKFEKIVEYADVCVGDTFAARVRGNRFIQYDNNTNCLTEDLTAYASVEAAVGDQWGNKNYYNRLLSLPGYGYEVDPADEKFSYWSEKGWITEYEGKYYGPEAIWSVSNFVNANENIVGPQVTNYKANQRHDDAFNIHGVYSSVTDYSYFTKTITYNNSASAYGNITKHFKAGDRILVYLPSTGRILGETTAAEDTVSHNGGEYFTLKLTDALIYYYEGAIMFNLSAMGDGFLYDNCELRMSYPRGGVVKAGGTIQYCSISETGRAGILICPEVVDTNFCESGYVNGFNFLYNEMKNTNLTEELTDDNSALAIMGNSKNLSSGYVKHKNIVIKGNRFENWGAHAIYIDSADGVEISDNIFVDNDAYSESRSPIYISGAKNVEVSGNSFPVEFKYNQRAEYSASDTDNIYGSDLIEKLYDASHLTNLRQMLFGFTTVDYSYDFYKDGQFDVRDLVRLKRIIANQ
ncbi:MAG: right-handed parallel beta-helix repeat-containing protein [Clostridia bacterium]|nr:right-handed parallel beta-helix repeat-containing protein [Clostridia bacterium]